MKKNPHDRILKEEPKEQHLSTVPKYCSFFIFQTNKIDKLQR